MIVAALYDIHGNLPALEAALRDVEAAAPDLVLVGGDIVPGPMPEESLELLLGLGDRVLFISGNADRETVQSYENPVDPWTAERISPASRAFLASLPEQQVAPVDVLGDTLFCHGSPRSDEELITATTPDELLREMLVEVEERVVVCGHTHMQFDRVVGETRVVNAGSVGMPYGAPGAFWALLGPDVELRRTQYDGEEAGARIRATGWPAADKFVRENVLTVPSAAEALAYFESVAERSERRRR